MRVIFLKDVPRVGRKYDIKEVNDGYAMNFLLPRKLAMTATPKAVAELELKKKEIVIEREVQENLLLKNLEEIKDKVLHMTGKTDEKGHLFSGIRARDIVEAMKTEYHADINEGAIKLEKPIKEIGEFTIPLEIQGKKSFFKLVVEKI
ncbi:50S ribosomal protein L9 [Candidatus Nomurabacteria bacterium RIFCSPLOWO2_02_40_28]|uniref:Large ribosomal subunit protein bL9 n=2 Tax=Candidatus Nomuraibacteriota TaxID=1752729 RepID=A0A837HVF2_9BACT|nr:MAG: 50S ribosomal protein L9 [Candidatus Nomurabacteria bacterium GW2011_GWD2_39_12]KKR21010.1 MAG: 50S ribosomal protein L9 [Candidatus Nomurabacteria bacterium GW2011_GWC2_39_41]KKR37013.1 MAG: 50S ribosomal protein L9 [Candidatus Nomurabacteria bacterium GW2011_GWE2_40_10]KKR38959.1 MAG: 50S ribosomal protein L9 [Candidatus Nomurabacteria bacterium GW2011_GWB1_40_11]KKR40201.1 MAG: 50S ribosomal protein L9 [Parcubacteria group bacterium GW2011_GWC1_40_11]KKR59346.1 MAG: 50S ribosomal pr